MRHFHRLWTRAKGTLNRIGWDARRLPHDNEAWSGPYKHQIYDELRAIFVHVPKTGGSSMERALSPYLGKPYAGGHTTALEFAFICPEEWRTYFRFGFVRDPWDRLLSAHAYLMRLPPELGIVQQDFIRDRFLRYADDIEGFVAALARHPSAIYFSEHLRPQVSYLCDPSGKVLVDFVGRFERIDEEWARVCTQIGIEVPLPHVRRAAAPRPPYGELYSDRSREQVAQLYRRDIEIFGYRFEG